MEIGDGLIRLVRRVVKSLPVTIYLLGAGPTKYGEESMCFRHRRVALMLASAWLVLVFGSFIALSLREAWPKIAGLPGG